MAASSYTDNDVTVTRAELDAYKAHLKARYTPPKCTTDPIVETLVYGFMALCGYRSDGIKEDGVPTALVCDTCGGAFVGNVGTVTIKGPSPPPTTCAACDEAKRDDWLMRSLADRKRQGKPLFD